MSPEKIGDQAHLSEILDEVDTLLMRIARTVGPDDLKGFLNIQQFHDMISRLCDKAPDTAQGIADAIQKRLDSQRQITGMNTRPPTRKRRRNRDAPYHPSKSYKTRTNRLLRSDKETENQGYIDDEVKPTVIPNTGLSAEATSATTGTTEKEQPSEPTEVSGTRGTTPSLPLAPDRSIARSDAIMEDVFEVAQTLHQLSQHRDSTPTDIHKRIFQLFQGNDAERRSASTGNQWSDGSIWIRVLDMGSGQQRKVTILNMLEYMGAWEWYDGQVRIAQSTVLTKKGKLVDRRGAATHVLDGIERPEMTTEERPRWISGVGQVTVHNKAVHTPKNSTSTTSGNQRLRRKQITMQLSRGQKLTTQLVKELGIGILFHQKIWDFTKMEATKLDCLIQDVKNNTCYMKLLHILSSQLELLLWKGSPDLDRFYADLQAEDLLAENELEELQGIFFIQHGNLLRSKVSTAVDDLIKRVRSNILVGSKPGYDGFTVSGSVELSCDVFQRFHPGKWLDAWAILAAMHISDKPANVTYSMSIPLDEEKNNQIQQIEKPLSRWAKKIEQYKHTLGPAPLVHFCPINHRRNHFTLLELNEKEKIIRHYDSMGKPDLVKRVQETRLSKLVQEEFGSLGFSYLEAPTPQQSDNWSCGIRVVWNFRQLSNDLSIGSWDTVLSPESMALEVVNGLITCVEENTVKKCR